VLAVFRRAFYLRTDAGGIVGLGPAGLGPGPLYGLCELPEAADWSRSGLAPGRAVAMDGDVLRVGPSFEFEWRSAPVWNPPRLPAHLHPDALARGLRTLADIAAAGRGGGLAPLIPVIAGARAPNGSDGDDPLRRRMLAGVRGIEGWLRSALCAAPGECPAPGPAAAGLIGLGPGLTPSGDDFLGGVLIALHAFGRVRAAACLAGWVLPRARSGTGAISLAHLACACEGEGIAPLHETLDALARGRPDALAAAVERLSGIGHSSGWDALAGLACAVNGVRHEFASS